MGIFQLDRRDFSESFLGDIPDDVPCDASED
jgi:hypothetical protein